LQTSTFPKDLPAFQRHFGTEAKCRAYLEKVRWANGFKCPKCSGVRCWQLRNREIRVCAACEYHCSLRSGTVFENSAKPLRQWFLAMFHVTTSKQGLSAKELQRLMGFGNYRTAWTWLHKLRECMKQPGLRLGPEVEVDIMVVGGVAHKRADVGVFDNKADVLTMVERRGFSCGRASLVAVPGKNDPRVMSSLTGTLTDGAIVVSDGGIEFRGIHEQGHFRDLKVSGPYRRGRNEAVASGHTHTPCVNRVISLFKRWALGTHQGSQSIKHLQAYLDEYCFRFNLRSDKAPSGVFRRLLEKSVVGRCRTYWQIVGRQAPHAPLRPSPAVPWWSRLSARMAT
jgi:ISXO2-like transposase domain/Transposase zinc-ribbon domain